MYNYNKLINVYEDLKLDEDLKTLFEYILAYGNYMNGSGPRGGAYGFKLDILLKLVDIKSPSNTKLNFLFYVL